MRNGRRDRRREHVRVDREGVHQRPLATARAVGVAEVADEGGRRVSRTDSLRAVRAARREPDSDHPQAWIDVLERVVAAGEQVLVRLGGDVAPVGPELRHPERAQVRLVADDHAVGGGHLAREPGGKLGELLALRGRARRVAAQAVPDDEEEAQALLLRHARDVVDATQALRRRGAQAGRPAGGHDDGVETRAPGDVDRAARGDGILLCERVVDHADHEGVPARALWRGRRG